MPPTYYGAAPQETLQKLIAYWKMHLTNLPCWTQAHLPSVCRMLPSASSWIKLPDKKPTVTRYQHLTARAGHSAEGGRKGLHTHTLSIPGGAAESGLSWAQE